MHDNTRHTTRFTVIGNHLAQHAELSLLAIGLAVHIQSLPAGARVDIKTLTARFPEGATRIAAALRELEAHHYLRRERERVPGGRIVTRTVSCNQPSARRPTASGSSRRAAPPARTGPRTHLTPTRPPAPPHDDQRPAPRRKKKRPLPAVPQPAYPATALLQSATDIPTGLRDQDRRLLLSACDTAHLAPGVAAWLERDVTPDAVHHALTTGLPPEGPRHAAALLAHRLITRLPPPPPFREPTHPPAARHPFQNCDGCERVFRAPQPGKCGDCRAALPEAR